MAQYDLSKTLIPYLDRHLSFPLLAHLGETGLFPAKEVTVAQYELAKGTNMFDYAKGIFEGIYPGETVPAGACSATHLVLFLMIYPHLLILKSILSIRLHYNRSQNSTKSAQTQCQRTSGCNKRRRPSSMSLKIPTSRKLSVRTRTKTCNTSKTTTTYVADLCT